MVWSLFPSPLISFFLPFVPLLLFPPTRPLPTTFISVYMYTAIKLYMCMCIYALSLYWLYVFHYILTVWKLCLWGISITCLIFTFNSQEFELKIYCSSSFHQDSSLMLNYCMRMWWLRGSLVVMVNQMVSIFELFIQCMAFIIHFLLPDYFVSM